MKYVLVDSIGVWAQGPFHNYEDVMTHIKTLKNREYEGDAEVCIIDPNDGENGLSNKERRQMIAQCHRDNTPLFFIVPLREPH